MAAYLGQTAEQGSAGKSFAERDEKVAARADRGAAIRIYGALVILLFVTTVPGLAMLDGSITAWISGGPLERICQSR
jgi:hypothetical protein